MDTLPFDPADYLDSDEAIAAYLADAGTDGEQAMADAIAVVARARQIMQSKQRRSGVGETPPPPFRNRE